MVQFEKCLINNGINYYFKGCEFLQNIVTEKSHTCKNSYLCDFIPVWNYPGNLFRALGEKNDLSQLVQVLSFFRL